MQKRPAAAEWPGDLPVDVEASVPRRWRDDVRAARSAAQALYACAGSRRNRMMMRKDGILPLLARLIQSDKAQLLVPIVGILNHFAKEVKSLRFNSRLQQQEFTSLKICDDWIGTAYGYIAVRHGI